MDVVNDLEQRIAVQLERHGLRVERPGGTGAELVAVADTREGPVSLVVQAGRVPRHPGPPPSPAAGPTSILAEPYVSARRARTLRAQGLPYVDTAGNMWLVLPGFHVEVEGRARPDDWSAPPAAADRLSRPSSLRVLFTLLTRPTALQLTLRELADACGTSVGAAQATVADLTSEGFLLGSVPERRLRRTGTLADRWVSHFRSRLLPKLDHLTLRGPAPQWWIEHLEDVPAGEVALGGEAACERLGYPLRSVETLLYGQPPWAAVRRAGRLGSDGGSTVVLRQRFWPVAEDDQSRFAPALLVYADLLAADEPRLVAVAEQLRDGDDELRRLWAS